MPNTAATFIHKASSLGRPYQICNSILQSQRNLSDCVCLVPLSE